MKNDAEPRTTWPFFRFGLLVTGKTEEKHAPLLFRSLAATQTCRFEVIRRVAQLRPRTSKKRLTVTGTNKPVTKRAEEEISFPTRAYLGKSVDHFVILLDDLEYDRRLIVQDVYEMYRRALDHLLRNDDPKRASMHFLGYMLEAYYFGDPDAVNAALALNPPLPACEKDVQTIRHPKGKLEQSYRGFREVDDGGRILELLNVERVLASLETCASFRTLFAWCAKIVERHPHRQGVGSADVFRLTDGIMSSVTRPQIEGL